MPRSTAVAPRQPAGRNGYRLIAVRKNRMASGLPPVRHLFSKSCKSARSLDCVDSGRGLRVTAWFEILSWVLGFVHPTF